MSMCANNNGRLSITVRMWHRNFCTPIIKIATSANFRNENFLLLHCSTIFDRSNKAFKFSFKSLFTRHIQHNDFHLSNFNFSQSVYTLNGSNESALPKETVFFTSWLNLISLDTIVALCNIFFVCMCVCRVTKPRSTLHYHSIGFVADVVVDLPLVFPIIAGLCARHHEIITNILTTKSNFSS